MDKAAASKKPVDPEPAPKKLKKSEKPESPRHHGHSGIPNVVASPQKPKPPSATAAKPAEETESLKQGIELRDKLQAEWNKGETGRNMQLIAKYLDESKVMLINLKYLEKSGRDISTGEETLTRDVLEIGVMYSVFKDEPDMELFSSYISQLKTYYYDYGQSIAPSPRKYEILGANLIYLLSGEHLGEFQLEVARILYPIESSPEILQNVFIKRAIELERALEEGRFSQIHTEDGPQMQSRLWRYFVQKLSMSTREKIAETIEAAYDRFSCKSALGRLKFNNQAELEEFATKRNWVIENGFYLFNHTNAENDTVPAHRLLKDFLGYASDLETII